MLRLVLKPWREKRSLSQNALSPCGTAKSVNTSSAGVKRSPLSLGKRCSQTHISRL